MAFGRPKDGVFFVARGSTPYVVPYKRRKNGLWATTRGVSCSAGRPSYKQALLTSCPTIPGCLEAATWGGVSPDA